MKDNFVSIIIPCKEIDDYADVCINQCQRLDYPSFELIILPDFYNVDAKSKHNVKIIPTGPVRPSVKRNLGVSRCNGDILAFIDADAVPFDDWIKQAIPYFEDEEVGIVGGPNITPPDAGIMETASGLVLSSSIGGGKFAFRYSSKSAQECDELPSCNLFVRRADFTQAGGFEEGILTAEDAKLCFQIKRNGKKIIYSPDVTVYHHRRPLFIPHLRQMWNYGNDKATLFKIHPEFKRPFYYIPSLFLIAILFGGILAIGIEFIRPIYVLSFCAYVLLLLVAGISTKNLSIFPLVSLGIALTHITYGAAFLKGSITR
jgi:cellulose synthase/poly-beta-1,6-N-acetylglucosamine synthase-like glycosyltransferase